ncbi:helix-turn-helix transcriptional regulator [Dyadobacter fermentans]|uniref:Transcriptional regulator, AraC family n=1 Tax=Dyadobacter fermentans (strain ATCC 700827 / DSM 18053 / CIP 107007 / KCTC 52180 / NS114) TaxID=471854 RepID=C6VTN2_DYAFD|nr:AraC family transcriptional regulator [Dyadobacter fermentans]ACT92975.1 transcriptional regulator, AraC family [Dyadobacter fermentans DSM 18053]
MKIEVIDQYGEVKASGTVADGGEMSSPYYKTSYSTVEKYWTSSTTEISAGQSHIAVHDVDVKEQVSIKASDAPVTVGLLFLEKGNIRVKQPDKSFREIGTLQHNLIYNAHQTEETLFAAGQNIRLTVIHLSPDYFFRLAEGGSPSIDRMATDMAKGNGHSFAAGNHLQISFPMLKLLNSLDSGAYNVASLRLYTEARILELLSLQIAQIEDNSQNSVLSKLNDGDVKRLNLAREFILSDISFTPSLEAISLEVGMNVYKLKTGFKALFGQSLFNYLREERLTTAYQEIAKRDRSLTEIAYQTGFASISHFSDAFKNRYGVSPSQLR